MDTTGNSYLEGVMILGVTDTSGRSAKPFVSKRVKNKDTEKLAAYYRYTSTELDLDATTFKDAISKGKYQKDECFINSITDFYGDNLMRPDTKKEIL